MMEEGSSTENHLKTQTTRHVKRLKELTGTELKKIITRNNKASAEAFFCPGMKYQGSKNTKPKQLNDVDLRMFSADAQNLILS